MRSHHVIAWVSSILLVIAVAACVAAEKRKAACGTHPPQAAPKVGFSGRSTPPSPKPSPGGGSELLAKTGPTTRLQLDALEVSCSTQKLAELDLDAITKGCSTPADLLAKLNELASPARVLFRVDERFLSGRKIRLVNRYRGPVIQDIVTSKDGESHPRVSYNEIGYDVTLNTVWNSAAPPRATVQCNIAASFPVESSVEASSGVKLPSHTEVKIEKTLTARDGQPVYAMTSSLPECGAEQGPVRVLIIRLVVTRLEE